MRLIAIHDHDGRVSTLIVAPPDAPAPHVDVAAGQLRTELDASDAPLDITTLKIPATVQELTSTYRVAKRDRS